MSWAFQGVANACLEILLLIAFGYVMTWKGYLTDKFLPQVNSYLLLIAYPALNIVALGIDLDLNDSEGWKSTAAYIMWVGIIQVSILVYVWVFANRDVGEAALLNLLLAANNTVIIGLPLMDSTWGSQGRYVALLSSVPFFVQVFPFTLVLFELEKWMVRQAAGAVNDDLASLNRQASSSSRPGAAAITDGQLRDRKKGDIISVHNSPHRSSSSSGVIRTQHSCGEEDDLNGLRSSAGALTARTDQSSSSEQPCIGDRAASAGIANVFNIPTNVASAFPYTSAVDPMHRLPASRSANDLQLTTDQSTAMNRQLSGTAASQGIPAAIADTGNAFASPFSNAAMASPVGFRRLESVPEHALTCADTSPSRRPHPQDNMTPIMRQISRSACGAPVGRQNEMQSYRGSMQQGSPYRYSTGGSLLDDLGVAGVADRADWHALAPLHEQITSGHMRSLPLPLSHMHDAASSTAGAQHQQHVQLHLDPLFEDQWRIYLQHFHELNRRRKELKKQQRRAVSVIDVPMPIDPRIQMGQRLGGQLDEDFERSLRDLDDDIFLPTHYDRQELSMDRKASKAAVTIQLSGCLNIDDRAADTPSNMQSSAAPTGILHRMTGRIVSAINIRGFGFAAFAAGKSRSTQYESATQATRTNAQNDDDFSPVDVGCLQRRSGIVAAARVRSEIRLRRVQKAMSRVLRREGGLARTVSKYMHANTHWWRITLLVIQNAMFVTTLLAIAISVSGLRHYLDVRSPKYVFEVGWLVQVCRWLSDTAVPLALFSNGVFLHGRRFWEGNMKKAGIILAIKILVLPALQLACAKVCGLSAPAGMSLVALAVTPCASASFVLATQYQHGAELVTMVTVGMTMLLVPLQLAALDLPRMLGIYDFDSSHFPLP